MIFVIHEEDEDGTGQSVIGLASSLETADKMILEYFGGFKVISFRDIRDSSLEWEKTIEVSSFDNSKYKVRVWVETFTIDTIN